MKLTGISFVDWAHYLTGGLYLSSKFPNYIKYLFLALILGNTSIIALGGITHFITTKSSNPLNTARILSITIISASMPFLVILITFCHRHNVTQIISYLKYPSKAKRHYRWSTRRWLCLGIICTCSAYLLTFPFLHLLFRFEKKAAMSSFQHHLLGVPFVDHIPSITLYGIVYFIEFCVMAFAMLISISECTFVIMVAYELDDIVVDYCTEMNYLSGTDTMFGAKLIKLIQRYQLLMRSIRSLCSYVQVFGSVFLPVIILFVSCHIFMILMIDSELPTKLRILGSISFCLIFLYLHCSFGDVLDDMRERIIHQVYNLPWYSQPPRQRAVVYIFLNQVQRPLTLKAFGIIPIDKTLFPKILRVTYTIGSLLVVMQH